METQFEDLEKKIREKFAERQKNVPKVVDRYLRIKFKQKLKQFTGIKLK